MQLVFAGRRARLFAQVFAAAVGERIKRARKPGGGGARAAPDFVRQRVAEVRRDVFFGVKLNVAEHLLKRLAERDITADFGARAGAVQAGVVGEAEAQQVGGGAGDPGVRFALAVGRDRHAAAARHEEQFNRRRRQAHADDLAVHRAEARGDIGVGAQVAVGGLLNQRGNQRGKRWCGRRGGRRRGGGGRHRRNYSLQARWTAAMPPLRLKQRQRSKPAPASRSVSCAWSGCLRMDSTR